MVGAVVTDANGEIIGEGWHTGWGEAHAEVEAIRAVEAAGAGAALGGATLYVNLEPCSHHGKTPPCADLIVEKGIPRVVAAMEDPNPDVAGSGFQRLRDAGVDVTVGIREHEARRLNEAFVRHVTTGRPLVTVKLALTLDGRVATRTGDSRWITSAESRALVHRLRAESDAVLVGAGTARADDPRLTGRDAPPAGGRQPLRVVLDRSGTLPGVLKLFGVSDAARTVAFVATGGRPAYAESLEAAGGSVVPINERDGHLDLQAILTTLGSGVGLPAGSRRVQSVMVEAGPGLATAFLKADLADRLLAFVAPKLVGDDGIPAVGDLDIDQMAAALQPAESVWEAVGPDVLLRAYLRAV
jgi:diaminohydroxyphosphoribosylaminopyrimidine deaminase/5-amino-6-(5-phosphoribosylamino)uracil reductase